eukprot:m.57381 g.57381  ORF g.57381 m.57381 type:complete len:415 (-) comp13077_c0_seq1:45-1289(-)
MADAIINSSVTDVCRDETTETATVLNFQDMVAELDSIDGGRHQQTSDTRKQHQMRHEEAAAQVIKLLQQLKQQQIKQQLQQLLQSLQQQQQEKEKVKEDVLHNEHKSEDCGVLETFAKLQIRGWKTAREQKLMLKVLFVVEAMGASDQAAKPFRQARNLISHLEKNKKPSFVSHLPKFHAFVSRYGQTIADELVKLNISDQDLKYLFFIRLMALCREHMYAFITKHHSEPWIADLRDLRLDKSNVEAALATFELNKAKKVNQFRNALNEKKRCGAAQKVVSKLIGTDDISLQNAVDIARSCKVPNALVISAAKRAVGLKNLQQLLHILNSSSFKLRDYRSLPQTVENVRRVLNACPQLLELPRLLLRTSPNQTLYGNVYREDGTTRVDTFTIANLPDIGLIYEEEMQLLCKEHL